MIKEFLRFHGISEIRVDHSQRFRDRLPWFLVKRRADLEDIVNGIIELLVVEFEIEFPFPVNRLRGFLTFQEPARIGNRV